jgi:protein-disulfide isomerase
VSTPYRPQLVLPVSSERDHIRGPIDAPIVLLEYGDYECPFCGAAHPVVQELRRLMGNQMSVVYRHFPLTNVHPHAEPAAEAAEAAGAQGRFWAMHDMLFEHQDALEAEDLLAYAQAIGLDVPRFARELADGTHRPRVREDFLSGVRSGVSGTPTFYVNGVRHEGPADLQSLLWSVQQHVRAA